MEIGLNLGNWGNGNDASNIALALEADSCGYSSVWVAEAYGSDAVTILSWIGAQTSKIDLGSAVLQIPARTPANAAMTSATLDALSGGRFRLGLGVSGPQVSEGWHGVRFDKPLTRTREYVSIVRDALARKKVSFEGEFFTLPLPGGPGKALAINFPAIREHLPIYLAAIGPKNLELCGEIADGWLAIFYSPEYASEQHESIARGRAKIGKTMDGFDVVPTVPVVVGDDPQMCAHALRASSALYIGGMGSREKNFYNQLAVRMGFDEAAAQVQDLFLDGKYKEAAMAVPFEFIDQTSLLGSPARIADRLAAYEAAGVTTLSIMPVAESLEQRLQVVRLMAELVDDTPDAA